MKTKQIQTRDEMASSAKRSIVKAVDDARYGLDVSLIEDAPFWLACSVESLRDAAALGAPPEAILAALDETARLAKKVRSAK